MNAFANIVAQNEVAQKIVAQDKAEAAAPKAKKAGAKKDAPVVVAKEEKAPAAPQARTKRPVAAKAVETTKPAATVAAAIVKALPIKYKVNPMLRAAQDNRLFSHTEAFLQLFGMYEKGTMSRTVLDDIMGGKTTANYHIKKGRFIEGKQGLSLTKDGKEWFKARGLPGNTIRFIPQDVEAYKEILTTGADTSGRIVSDKNKHMVTAFTAK